MHRLGHLEEPSLPGHLRRSSPAHGDRERREEPVAFAVLDAGIKLEGKRTVAFHEHFRRPLGIHGLDLAANQTGNENQEREEESIQEKCSVPAGKAADDRKCSRASIHDTPNRIISGSSISAGIIRRSPAF